VANAGLICKMTATVNLKLAKEIGMKSRIELPAIDFCLGDASGIEHRLADYSGKWLLMVFHRHLG